MKRKTKKPVSVLLCIVLLLSLIPLTAFADESKAVKITEESKTVDLVTDTAKFISLDEAKEIALKDAELDRNKQKITFTKEELSRNKGRPCYLLDFYTEENQYHYEVDAKTGEVIYGRKYILLTEAKKIAVDDAGCTEKVTFTEEELVDGGIKTPYYLLVFADNKTQWTYRINAVSGDILEKKEENIGEADLISLEKAKSIALNDAGLIENAEKIVFTKEELIRNQGKPYYLLEFYTGKYQYHYEIDAKTGDIIYGRRYILLADAKRIAVDDAECSDKVTFLEEELVDGGIKTPYYRLVFADRKTQWTYRINAVSGAILEKKSKNTDEQDYISLEEAKKIALKDAGLDKYAQKIVFTKTELNRYQGKQCYLLEFYTGKNQYYYQIDAKTGEIIYGRRYILLAAAKKIAVDDAECSDCVCSCQPVFGVFFWLVLVDGGIKTPYYHLVFADRKTQWTYRINAVTGGILKKKQKDIKVKPDTEWENPFGDVKKRDWFYFSVKFAYDFGLMKGTTEMEFSPDSYVTRAMFVMIIYRMEKEPQTGGSVFVDVEIGGYYDRAVAWANANGIVSGVSKDRFAPNDPITREQMATILYRYANFKGYDVESNGNTAYSDSSSISGYARNAVSWAAANLLMKGDDDGSFLPNANATRAQAAAVFARMIENLE